MEKKLIYDIGDKPKFGQMLIFALQQVLAIQIPYAFAETGEITGFIKITSIATALVIGIVTNVVLTKVENSRLGKEKE